MQWILFSMLNHPWNIGHGPISIIFKVIQQIFPRCTNEVWIFIPFWSHRNWTKCYKWILFSIFNDLWNIGHGPICVAAFKRSQMYYGASWRLYPFSLLRNWAIDDGWLAILCPLFNSTSVISGQWADDNERLCAMKPHLRLRKFCPKARTGNLGSLDQ